MKINKTEKEFRDALRPAVSQLGSHPLERRLDAVISALDLEFLEEPLSRQELPSRLTVQRSSGMGTMRLLPSPFYALSLGELEEMYLEAAACYNTIRNLKEMAGDDFSLLLGTIVAEERRKLKKEM